MIDVNKLYNDDCINIMNKIKDNSIDCIITDPPYGVGFENNIYNDKKEYVFNLYEDWLKEMYRIIKNESHIYIFIPTKEIDKWILTVKNVGFNFKNIITTRCKNCNYLKNNFKYDTQFIIFATKGKGKEFNKIDIQKTSEAWLKDKRNKNKKEYSYDYSSLMYEFSTKLTKLSHPNEKAVEFINKLILLSTNENELILDPFMGSGSTIKSCIETKRNYIGIELNKEVFEKTKLNI